MELKNLISTYHSIINISNPNAKLPDIDTLFNECHNDNFSGEFYLNVYFITLNIRDSFCIEFEFILCKIVFSYNIKNCIIYFSNK